MEYGKGTYHYFKEFLWKYGRFFVYLHQVKSGCYSRTTMVNTLSEISTGLLRG